MPCFDWFLFNSMTLFLNTVLLLMQKMSGSSQFCLNGWKCVSWGKKENPLQIILHCGSWWSNGWNVHSTLEFSFFHFLVELLYQQPMCSFFFLFFLSARVYYKSSQKAEGGHLSPLCYPSYLFGYRHPVCVKLCLECDSSHAGVS